MDLRTDTRQFTIYDPDTVAAVYDALNAASLVMFGAWLQRFASRHYGELRDNLGIIGTTLLNIGEARQQIQAGLAPNDMPDVLVHAQRTWDIIARYNDNPESISGEDLLTAVSELAGAMQYLNERTMETGTNHPRWNSRIVSGTPCQKCGR